MLLAIILTFSFFSRELKRRDTELTLLLKAAMLRPLPGAKGQHRQGGGYQTIKDANISYGGLLRKYYATKNNEGRLLRCCHKYFSSSTYARGHVAGHLQQDEHPDVKLVHSTMRGGALKITT